MQAATWRLQLVPGGDVGGAGRQAEAAVDAVAQILGGRDVGSDETQCVSHRLDPNHPAARVEGASRIELFFQ